MSNWKHLIITNASLWLAGKLSMMLTLAIMSCFDRVFVAIIVFFATTSN